MSSLISKIRNATQNGHFRKCTEKTLEGRVGEANRLLDYWESDDGKSISDLCSRIFQDPYLQLSFNLMHEFDQKTEGLAKKLRAKSNDAQSPVHPNK